MECKIEGCNKPVKVKLRQLCAGHYQVWARNNRISKECTYEGCTNSHYAKGYCQKHYAKLRLYGTPVGSPRRLKRQCEVDGCENTAKTRNMCFKHYQRWYQQNRAQGAVNPDHWNTKDVPGIQAIHQRIRFARGSASEYDCVDGCGRPATDWSLRAGVENLYAEAGTNFAGTPYSLDINDYEPRCHQCHKAYDARNFNTQRYIKDVTLVVFKQRRQKNSPDLAPVVEAIESGMTIGDTARKLNISQTQVGRLYRTATGVSIRDFRAAQKAGVN